MAPAKPAKPDTPDTPDSAPLVDGGPSDQASVRPDPQDAGVQGSQSGRPQNQPPRTDAHATGTAPEHPREPAHDSGPAPPPAHEGEPVPRSRAAGSAHDDDGLRGVSETERRAGSPDEAVRTDTGLGDATR